MTDNKLSATIRQTTCTHSDTPRCRRNTVLWRTTSCFLPSRPQYILLHLQLRSLGVSNASAECIALLYGMSLLTWPESILSPNCVVPVACLGGIILNVSEVSVGCRDRRSPNCFFDSEPCWLLANNIPKQ